MESYKNKCIKFCSSIKVSLLYLCIDYHSLSLTAPSAILQEVVSVTVSTIQYSNGYHSIQYYYTMALLLIIIIFIIIKMYLLTNVITMLMQQTLQLPCSEYTNAHA